jgi:hypothetical protein
MLGEDVVSPIRAKGRVSISELAAPFWSRVPERLIPGLCETLNAIDSMVISWRKLMRLHGAGVRVRKTRTKLHRSH